MIFHCVYVPQLLYSSSVDGHLGCFHVLAIVNNATMNNGIHVSLSILVSSGNMPRKRQWHPTPVLLPGKSHGWRSLEGCSPGVAEGQTWLSNFTFTFHFHALEKEKATHSNVLAWRILGMGHPGGLPSMGSHSVGHDWNDSAAAAAWFNFRGTRDPGTPNIFLPYSIVP